MTSIEIGGGTLVQPGWINLDSRNGHGEWARMAQQTPWPTGDNTVDAIRASHVMEHIPAGQERIDVMNEAHRVLKPGGVFEVIVPIVNNPLTWHAIADPTHVSFWVLESFHYFDGHFAANADYGIRLWQTLELEVRGGFECHWKGTPR
ncbi:MAG TPA: methyltransferase domain-containing protein [Streptosporangiaceae bacterium]